MNRKYLAVLQVPLWLTLICAGAPSPRVLTLAAGDGTVLKATYFSAGKPGPGVLLFHQCNRDRRVWNGLARSLAQGGLNVLTLDFRGLGESGGVPFDKLPPQQATRMMNQTWIGDVETAFHFLVSQLGVKHAPIGVGGASCGVNQAVQLAYRHPQVKSLVLLSEGTNREGRKFIRASSSPPMFLAVADDDSDPGVVEVMEWLLSLSSNPANRFEHYPTGGHGVEMFAVHPELPGTIVTWFKDTLLYAHKSSTRVQASVRKPNILAWTDQPGGAAKVEQMLNDSRKVNPKATLFSEAVMNRIAYEHLLAGDTKGAVELFKLNVAAYPNSANVYDSLSDAYIADGQKDLARENALKALELLSSDTIDPEERRAAIKKNAEQKLKQVDDVQK